MSETKEYNSIYQIPNTNMILSGNISLQCPKDGPQFAPNIGDFFQSITLRSNSGVILSHIEKDDNNNFYDATNVSFSAGNSIERVTLDNLDDYINKTTKIHCDVCDRYYAKSSYRKHTRTITHNENIDKQKRLEDHEKTII